MNISSPIDNPRYVGGGLLLVGSLLIFIFAFSALAWRGAIPIQAVVRDIVVHKSTHQDKTTKQTRTHIDRQINYTYQFNGASYSGEGESSTQYIIGQHIPIEITPRDPSISRISGEPSILAWFAVGFGILLQLVGVGVLVFFRAKPSQREPG